MGEQDYRYLLELRNGESGYTAEWMVFTMPDGQSWILAHAGVRDTYSGTGTMKMKVTRMADDEVLVYGEKPEHSVSSYTVGFERGEKRAFRASFHQDQPILHFLKRMLG